MPAVERLLITLWAGVLWAVGYLAVPVLFANLDDRMLAGMLAGKMFTLVSGIGLVCGGLLLVLNRLRAKRLFDGRGLLLALMLLLVAVGEFVLQPRMAALKAQGLAQGSEVAARFATLHGVSSVLYLLTGIAALWLVWRGPRTTSAA